MSETPRTDHAAARNKRELHIVSATMERELIFAAQERARLAAAIDRLRAALARAEAGTPAGEEPTYLVPHARTIHTHPDTVRLDWLVGTVGSVAGFSRALLLQEQCNSEYGSAEWLIGCRAAIDAAMKGGAK
jgi:hypothetical protein